MPSMLFWAAAAAAAYAALRPRRSATVTAPGAPTPPLLPAPADPVASDSPNGAERLQPSHVGGAYAGIGALLPDGGQATQLLPASGGTGVAEAQGGDPSDAQADDAGEPQAPGLTQMFRGA